MSENAPSVPPLDGDGHMNPHGVLGVDFSAGADVCVIQWLRAGRPLGHLVVEPGTAAKLSAVVAAELINRGHLTDEQFVELLRRVKVLLRREPPAA